MKEDIKPIEEMTDDELDAYVETLPGSTKRHRVRPGVTSDDSKTKVKISLYVDLDVLNYFKKRAEEPNAAPYQTQINNELRAVMGGKRSKEQVRISSKQIEQIAKRVAAILKESDTQQKEAA
jgi:uncharacterized protein (DUF4415 family)